MYRFASAETRHWFIRLKQCATRRRYMLEARSAFLFLMMFSNCASYVHVSMFWVQHVDLHNAIFRITI
jgi:hypothetical protein